MTRTERRAKRVSPAKRALKIVGWAVGGAVAAGLLTIDAGHLGVPGLPQSYIVRSGSMTGTFDIGSLVVDMPVSHNPSFHRGEIVTFYNPTQPQEVVTHRIISVNSVKKEIQTKGDANPVKDPFVTPDKNVIGVYEGHIPYIGYVISFIQNRWQWLLTMVAALVGIGAIVRWVAKDDLMKERQEA